MDHILVLLGYTGLTALMTYPLVLQFGQAIPGDGFDGWQNYWNLWWVRLALVDQGSSPLFTGVLYYPTGVSLAFHTLNLYNGLFTLPVQLSAGLFPAYNSVVFFSFVAGAFGAYLLARYVLLRTGWRARWTTWPAVMAGIVFGFSPFHFAHLLGHMQVLSLEWLPFAALGLVRGVDQMDRQGIPMRKVLRAGILAAIFLILVGLCDWYYAMYMALFTALLVGYRLFTRRLKWQHLAVTGMAWLIFLVALAPMWLPMAREAGRADYMVPDETQALDLSADLLAFVTPNEFHPLWGARASEFAVRFTSTTSERIVFAGYLPLALGLVAAWKLGRRSRFWWVATLAFVVCALGLILHVGGRSGLLANGGTIPLPYAALYRVLPAIRIARSIARFDVMVMLSLSSLAALGLAWVMEQLRERGAWARGAGIMASAIVCFEFLSVPYPFSPPDTPAFYEQLGSESGEYAILNLPMNWDRPGYLLYQTVHEKPLTVAYISRNDPRTLIYRAPVLQEFRHLGSDILSDDAAQLGQSVFAWLQIRYVILDRYKMPGGLEREYTTGLAQRIFAGEAPVYEDERLTVYRVIAPEDPLPFAVLRDGWSARTASGGDVWRSVADTADLMVLAKPGQTLQLSAVAAGDAERSALEVQAPDGGWQRVELAERPGDVAVEWTARDEESNVAFHCKGNSPCRILAIRVRSVAQ